MYLDPEKRIPRYGSGPAQLVFFSRKRYVRYLSFVADLENFMF